VVFVIPKIDDEINRLGIIQIGIIIKKPALRWLEEVRKTDLYFW